MIFTINLYELSELIETIVLKSKRLLLAYSINILQMIGKLADS